MLLRAKTNNLGSFSLSFNRKNHTQMRVKIMDFGLHLPSYCAIITLRNTQYMAISDCEKGESVMAEVKTIRQYRTKQDGNTLIEFPIVDEESKNIIEVNFNQYIDVLSDILLKYAVNFRSGRQWVVPLSAKHKKVNCIALVA